MTTPTVGQVKAHAVTLAAMASALLTALESGKYAPEIALTEKVLGELGVVLPPPEDAEMALKAFSFLNALTAPRGRIVPDGRGGEANITNSRVMPDGSFRAYDPAIDGT
jgi:hypothetical protein